MARAKRRLTDLYVVGKEVEFDDGEGEPIKVYVRKLNAGQHDRALRRANAERSKLLATKKHPESEEYTNQWAIVEQFSRVDLVEYLGEDEKQRRAAALEAELAAEDEWSKDDYLQGLRDAWNEGLSERAETEPDDVEVKRVSDELERFNAAANKIIKQHVASFTDDMEDISDDVLQQRVFDKLVEVQASLAWLTEYRACELWLSVRDEDKVNEYFNHRDEINSLPNEVIEKLMAVYREISVDPLEGKSSRQTDTSSTSSEPVANTETEDSSTPPSVTE